MAIQIFKSSQVPRLTFTAINAMLICESFANILKVIKMKGPVTNMPKYVTKQRTQLLDFFEHNHDCLHTAREIAEQMADDNISVSAIYRNLADLEAEGKLRKATRPGVRDVYYQYIDADACRNQLHLSCEKCGKTFHASEAVSSELLNILSKCDSFAVDKSTTVLYGLCKDCR